MQCAPRQHATTFSKTNINTVTALAGCTCTPPTASLRQQSAHSYTPHPACVCAPSPVAALKGNIPHQPPCSSAHHRAERRIVSALSQLRSLTSLRAASCVPSLCALVRGFLHRSSFTDLVPCTQSFQRVHATHPACTRGPSPLAASCDSPSPIILSLPPAAPLPITNGRLDPNGAAPGKPSRNPPGPPTRRGAALSPALLLPLPCCCCCLGGGGLRL